MSVKVEYVEGECFACGYEGRILKFTFGAQITNVNTSYTSQRICEDCYDDALEALVHLQEEGYVEAVEGVGV